MALLCPDLLFASRIEAPLRAAGHEVVSADDGRFDLLVVDLTADGVDPAALASARAVGFYPHVDQETRRRAEEAGFALVVPRSRMAREPAAVVARALDG